MLLRRALSSLSSRRFDVVVVGGGPVGCEAARLSATLGHKVAVVEATRDGALLAAPTGWVSKALRFASRELGTASGDRRVPWRDVGAYVENTAGRALGKTAAAFAPLVDEGRVEAFAGPATFVGTNKIAVGDATLEAATVFLATGSTGTRVPSLPWDDPAAAEWLYDSDTIMGVGRLPEHVLIQGGGVIGVEYAFILRHLGARVTLVLREPSLLDGKAVDDDIRSAIAGRLEKVGVTVRYEDGDVVSAEPPRTPRGPGRVVLGSGEAIACDVVLSAVGRSGATASLDLAAGGLRATPQGHVDVDAATMRASGAARVWAAGDCAGRNAVSPPGLLSTGLAQCHVAVRDAFPDEWATYVAGHGSHVGEAVKEDAHAATALWIEDGVGAVGLSAEQAADAHGPDASSIAVPFNDTIKACVQPRPDDEFLKLVFQRSTGRILGVHIFGRDAAEMVQHAAVLVNGEKTIWTAIKEVPPAVTYGEVLMSACFRAVDDLGGGALPRKA